MPQQDGDGANLGKDVLIIAHRGASGERPEHTLASYERAIDQGADYVEPDLVFTKDGFLVARHENAITDTTDVADHPEFADRKTSKTIDGHALTGWFTEDFTLAELRTLRARERLPELRRSSADFDGLFQIPTFDEIIALVRVKENETGRTIGIYPETKHPSYFEAIGLSFDGPLLKTLHNAGYVSADAPIFIQSFEIDNLRRLNKLTDIRLIQLIRVAPNPADHPELDYKMMTNASGLKDIAQYADGIGVQKTLVLPRSGDDRSTAPSSLVADAHMVGLDVHIWTLRRENIFLPAEYRQGSEPQTIGDFSGEIAAFVAAGVDGIFTDNTKDVVSALRD
ncbi:glycerophosphodiester phosphodiesterase [Parasphingorhabdus sp. DH2-15]|uniref:glycerophosphodiester phosphodiesterase n=1 Tax=Parasphingorhabdus sp. DH2-15 TaxID=3444112 RepID=UPI003F689205